MRRPVGDRLRRLGFVSPIVTRTTIYLALFMVAQFAAAHAVSGPAGAPAFDAELLRATQFSLTIAAVFTVVVQVNRMLEDRHMSRCKRR